MPTNTITQILHISRSGMLGRLTNLDTVGNNLANVNTIGYKTTRLNFQETLTRAVLGGVATETTQRLNTTEGSFKTTQDPLNMVIDGEGYFSVRLADGTTAYTRDGNFHRDASGQIVNDAGDRLIWTGTLPATLDDIQVTPDGNGTVRVKQGNAWNTVGRINLTRFPNPDGLTGIGDNLWQQSAISGAAQTGVAGSAAAGGGQFGKILGNLLENSNVNVAEEMSQMILLQRAYSFSVRAFQQTDQMFGLANQMRR
jgi:flagellar basal-body rod protein FlgG